MFLIILNHSASASEVLLVMFELFQLVLYVCARDIYCNITFCYASPTHGPKTTKQSFIALPAISALKQGDILVGGGFKAGQDWDGVSGESVILSDQKEVDDWAGSCG